VGTAIAVDAIPAPPIRTVSVQAVASTSSGATDPIFQALIVEGLFTTVPAGPRSGRGLGRVGDALAAWLSPPFPRAGGRRRAFAGWVASPVDSSPWPDAPAGTPGGEIRIEHHEVGCVVAERHPRLEACLAPRDRIGRVQLRFRPKDTQPWYAVDMEPDGECFSGLLPKPKPTLAAFEYYIGVVDVDYDERLQPDAAPETTYSARVVRSEGDCDKEKRIASSLLRVAAPILLGTPPGAGLPAGFSDEGVVVGGGLAGVTASLVATGASSGEVLQLQATNTSGAPVRIAVSPGLVLLPLPRGAGTPVAAKAKGRLHTDSVSGYCLEFAKPPPPPGTLYRVAEPDVQGRFRGAGRLLSAGRRLARAAGFHPDSDTAAYTDSIRQWALWARLAGWSSAQFTDAFVSRTRKNVEEMKRPWNPEMEAAIRAAAPGRWRDIARILADADGTARGPAE